jgi:hypothetical protein
MEGGPIVTTFARRIPESSTKYIIISSLLETIRLSIVRQPEKREDILSFTATLLNNLIIDDTIRLAVRATRAKIEQY